MSSTTSRLFSMSVLVMVGALVLFGCKNPVSPGTTAASFAVKYDSNGATSGIVPTDSNVYQKGQRVTVLDNTGNLHKPGGVFAAWNTESNGSGTSYAAGATFDMGSVNVTLYVQWTGMETAIWAQTPSGHGSGPTEFNGVAVGPSDNLYAVGYQSGGPYDYGTGVSASGVGGVVVKYNSDGVAQWAQVGGSTFLGAAVDPAGNVYAVGYQSGTNQYTYGSFSATGTSTGSNAVIVKYGPQGTALWAHTVSTGTAGSEFAGVAVDSSGNVYAVGYQGGTEQYTYGSVSATAPTGGDNVILVKYDSKGTAQWAQTVTAATGISQFFGVSVDPSGNIYAVGYQGGNGPMTYGSGVSAVGGYAGGDNVAIVKYNALGAAQWARTANVGSNHSWFYGVSVDSSGSVYAVGYQDGTGQFDYGNGATVTGVASYTNSVIVKYDSAGTAQWAQTVSGTLDTSVFAGVAVDSSGNVYAVGEQFGPGQFSYGNGVTASATGTPGRNNAVIVKYDSQGKAQWAQTVSGAGSYTSIFSGVAVDSAGNGYAAGYQYGPTKYTYGTDVSANGACFDGDNAVLVKYGP